MWKRFKHPNIVPFIGVTWDPLQFVSEWMPNGTLTQYLCKNPEVNRICLVSLSFIEITPHLIKPSPKLLDIAEGLTFLHVNYTTHGDLKGVGAFYLWFWTKLMTFGQPNILINHDGHACLTDFGFSSVVRGMDSVSVTEVQGYTPRWAAPEVLGGGDKNTWEADVFAFGMVMVEVCLCIF